MRLYHKAKRLGVWDPRSIDLTQDRLHWQQIPEDRREGVLRLIVGFQAGEEAVTLDLLPLILVMAKEGRLEEEMFLTTFLWEEAKHTEFFRRFLDEVAEVSEDLHEYRAGGNATGRDLFSDDLSEVMGALITDQSPAAQLRASVLYNMFIEGVLAEAGYQRFASLLDQTGMMPGLREGLGYIKRDESRHIAYGTFLVSRLLAEQPSLWSQVEEQMNELISRFQVTPEVPNPEFINAAHFQFQKRMAILERVRGKTLEQVYQATDAEIGVAEAE
jgi:ribonucleoside-diphosphate reductase beta chain